MDLFQYANCEAISNSNKHGKASATYMVLDYKNYCEFAEAVTDEKFSI